MIWEVENNRVRSGPQEEASGPVWRGLEQKRWRQGSQVLVPGERWKASEPGVRGAVEERRPQGWGGPVRRVLPARLHSLRNREPRPLAGRGREPAVGLKKNQRGLEQTR